MQLDRLNYCLKLCSAQIVLSVRWEKWIHGKASPFRNGNPYYGDSMMEQRDLVVLLFELRRSILAGKRKPYK